MSVGLARSRDSEISFVTFLCCIDLGIGSSEVLINTDAMINLDQAYLKFTPSLLPPSVKHSA